MKLLECGSFGGSPRIGPVACSMRTARANFEYVLRQCRREEEAMRAEALSAKLLSGNNVGFWQDIRSLSPNSVVTPKRVDQVVGDNNIAELWRQKFSATLNSVNDSNSKEKYRQKLTHSCEGSTKRVTVAEIQSITKKLENNKAVGMDLTPNEFYKFAPLNVLIVISLFFGAFLNHSFLPNILMRVLIIPLLKSKMKDPTISMNYRPIAISTAASKIFENLMLTRLHEYMYTTDNQFGFKSGHSTELCIYALKEIIDFYRNLNSPVFLCFLDIKSAFDRVSYWAYSSKC